MRINESLIAAGKKDAANKLRCCVNGPPDVPVMDGCTATVKIRGFDKKTPIAASTASATSDVRERVLRTGMQDYIVNPFNPGDLILKLKKCLN